MNINKLVLRVSLASVLCLLALSGCTRHPSPEEMAILEQQIAAAETAETKVEDLEQEKARLEAELNKQEKILSDHNAEFEEIKRRMAERGLEAAQ